MKNNRKFKGAVVCTASRYGALTLFGSKGAESADKQSDQDLISGGFMAIKKSFINNHIREDELLNRLWHGYNSSWTDRWSK